MLLRSDFGEKVVIAVTTRAIFGKCVDAFDIVQLAQLGMTTADGAIKAAEAAFERLLEERFSSAPPFSLSSAMEQVLETYQELFHALVQIAKAEVKAKRDRQTQQMLVAQITQQSQRPGQVLSRLLCLTMIVFLSFVDI